MAGPDRYTGRGSHAAAPAETVRNWSFAVLEREVRTNLVYRTFTRVGGDKVPDAKTMGKWGPVVGPTVIAGLCQQLETFVPRVQRVLRQARARILRGDTRVAGKLFSLFEPSTELIRKGKPNEFGKLVKLQEAEQQIITHFEVYDERPSDVDLLLPAIEAHQQMFGGAPRRVTADAAFYSAANEEAAHAKGVRRVCIPKRATKSAARKREQKKRWFKTGQRWRTGCEGRISVVKRRHGLDRSRYKGDAGIKRWVGLGVLADNLINISHVLATRSRVVT